MNSNERSFVHEHVWSYLRGELDSRRSAEFEEILIADSEAAKFVSDIHLALQAGKAACELSEFAKSDADRLFENVLRAVVDVDSKSLDPKVLAVELTQAAEQEPPASQADEESSPRVFSGLWVNVAFSLAAVALALILGQRLLSSDGAARSATSTGQNAVAASDHARPASIPAGTDAAEAAVEAENSAAPVNAELAFVPTFQDALQISENVRIFAEQGADYSFVPGNPERLAIEDGLVVVEYLPVTENALLVSAPGADFEVTGTVFSVDARAATRVSRVEVIWGEVAIVPSVATGNRQAARVQTGEILVEDGRVVATAATAPTVRESEARSLVDLDTHAREIGRLRAFQPAVVATSALPDRASSRSQSAAAQPDEPSASELVRLGRSLLREGDSRAAASNWERALRSIERGSADEAAVRLDLARLYLVQDPTDPRIAVHLGEFLNRFPNDAAAASARATLCTGGYRGPAAVLHCTSPP